MRSSERFLCCSDLECHQQCLQCTRVSGLSAYGSWCLGMLDNNCMILVKKFMYRKHDYSRKLCRDIAISSMVSGHKNFMMGCCLENKIPFMVYYGEEKQYSTVDLETVVSWKRRMKIAEDIAIALAYLHTAFPRPFVYANMNLRNILLDENGVAKLKRCMGDRGEVPRMMEVAKELKRFLRNASSSNET
ncbi:unnamed protein product [Thlaspi arvense]|uniref:Serine-threonine/tyrosine-protein kinase catalytic domain-containing protein n=1 Tax=Thlaspi arvense TaxID=13288 RepID=A0AAU9SL03_THLAR|nr:unnamed protein product [Thlaspi arvense]